MELLNLCATQSLSSSTLGQQSGIVQELPETSMVPFFPRVEPLPVSSCWGAREDSLVQLLYEHWPSRRPDAPQKLAGPSGSATDIIFDPVSTTGMASSGLVNISALRIADSIRHATHPQFTLTYHQCTNTGVHADACACICIYMSIRMLWSLPGGLWV